MESVTKEIEDLETAERTMLERWLGHPLDDIQRIILTVVPRVPDEPIQLSTSAQEIPPIWRVFEGISPSEMEQLEKVLSERANLTRFSPSPFESGSD